jgi:hypothetical protein
MGDEERHIRPSDDPKLSHSAMYKFLVSAVRSVLNADTKGHTF